MTNRRDNFYDEEMASMNERKDKQLQAAQEVGLVRLGSLVFDVYRA